MAVYPTNGEVEIRLSPMVGTDILKACEWAEHFAKSYREFASRLNVDFPNGGGAKFKARIVMEFNGKELVFSDNSSAIEQMQHWYLDTLQDQTKRIKS